MQHNLKDTTFIRAVLVLTLAVLADVGTAGSQPPSETPRDFDARLARRLEKAPPSAAQLAAEAALRGGVPGLVVDYDPVTGAGRTIQNRDGYLTTPAPGVDAETLALEFVETHRDILGLTARDLRQYEVSDRVRSARTGAEHFYLRQLHRNIPVYNGQLHVNVNRDGRILSVNNAFVPDLASRARGVAPTVNPVEALLAVAEHLGIELDTTPQELGSNDGPRRTTRVAAPGLSRDTVRAGLAWFSVDAGDVRLVWNFQVRTVDDQHWYDMNVDAQSGEVWTRFDWASPGTYRVFDRPDESPLHGSMSRVLVVDPEDPVASPIGWLTGGFMLGNNVTACPDTDGNNACDLFLQCSGNTCDFPLDLTQEPSTYIPAATVNLFYWNNLIHDIQYVYGFDEAAGNFQEDNFGRGGAGSDSVNADSQDGSGNCNANFSTPTDGGNPRMQMFTCNNTTPTRDGSFDNGVIVHEYGHGISIRQVGGPGNSSCLNNTQQGGEGWSDFWALMYTIEAGDAGTDMRGIGSYLFGLTPEGGTIRDLPYSTDPAINNWTYESIAGAAVPHGVGSRWAQVLWEMAWMLIDKHGFALDIASFDPGDPIEAGNKRAMFYVNEGFKNTACSPSFINARDGILQAVTDNFGGEDLCDVWQIFANYGLGIDAVSGGSNSLNPTNGFGVPVVCPQPIADAGPDQVICLGESTALGTPAQPNTTYSWSPGGETTAQITVSPTVDTTYTLTATGFGTSASDSATVFIDGGTAGLNDDLEDGSDWFATGLWHQTTTSACVIPSATSGSSAFYYGQDVTCTYATGAATTGSLTSPVILGVTATSTLEFQYWRGVESFSGDFDRTDVEIVTATGATNVFALNSSNPSTAGWVSSGPIDLSAFAGQPIQVRFVFDSVDAAANNFTGWLIDDVVVTGRSRCAPENGGPINWNLTATLPYADQDVDANIFVEDAGRTLVLTDNTWRQTIGTFEVTANTVLEFDFRADTHNGEIHGIGFDANNTLNDVSQHVQLFGRQPWSGLGRIYPYRLMYRVCGYYEPFQIHFGRFFTGTAQNLVLINDNDSGSGNDSRFRDVRVRQCSRIDNFEDGSEGWSSSPGSTCSTGAFTVGIPDAVNAGVLTQLSGDHSTGDGNALFTVPNTGGAGSDDVDGGICVANSPAYMMSEDSEVSIWYYHGQRDAGDDPGDFFLLEASVDGAPFQTLASYGDEEVSAVWRKASVTASAGQMVQLRVQVADGIADGDLIEAGIDDIFICPR